MKKQEIFRIRKADKDNWVIEKYEPGGELAKRGRTTGEPKAARWIIDGYFAQLKHAAARLPDVIVGSLLEGQEAVTGKEILAAILAAEEQSRKIVEDALATLPKAG